MSELKLSNCLGLQTPTPEEAFNFYEINFGMADLSDSHLILGTGGMELYLNSGASRPIVFEFLTEDLSGARETLARNDFEELSWNSVNGPCLVKDPFGLKFNVYMDPARTLEVQVMDPDPGQMVQPCIGAALPSPQAAAEFYSQLFEVPAFELTGESFFLAPCHVHMRFNQAREVSPLLWINPNKDDSDLEQFGCEVLGPLVIDPFGVQWRKEEHFPSIDTLKGAFTESLGKV